jgi:hypothetical protein
MTCKMEGMVSIGKNINMNLSFLFGYYWFNLVMHISILMYNDEIYVDIILSISWLFGWRAKCTGRVCPDTIYLYSKILAYRSSVVCLIRNKVIIRLEIIRVA